MPEKPEENEEALRGIKSLLLRIDRVLTVASRWRPHGVRKATRPMASREVPCMASRLCETS